MNTQEPIWDTLRRVVSILEKLTPKDNKSLSDELKNLKNDIAVNSSLYSTDELADELGL